jgi:hypothetical protein
MFPFKIMPLFGFDSTDQNHRLWLQTEVSELSCAYCRRTVYCIKSIFISLRFIRSEVHLLLAGVIVFTFQTPFMLTFVKLGFRCEIE